MVARPAEEFEGVLVRTGRDQIDGLFVLASGLKFANPKLIMDLALKSRLPAMANSRESTEAGGLMSCGYLRTEQFRQAALYVKSA